MAADKYLKVCLIGQKFMGRTHSNALLKVGKFFDLPLLPVMHTVCGRDRAELEAFKDRWGWQNASVDWRAALDNPEIGLVDIGTPNDRHAEMAIAALEAGKHVACEKPLANTLAGAKAMRDAAAAHPGSQTFVWYNYRRVPAVALAHQIVRSGKLGRIFHIRAYYLQDWATPDVPLTWRFQKERAGSGSHGDLAAHIIDMARFVSGQEITEIVGSSTETFVRERAIVTDAGKGGIGKNSIGGSEKGPVDVDDAIQFIARTSGGAMASFEATRMATGNQNKNGLEINGEFGSILFNFEFMNYLKFYDATADRKFQGWTDIIVTHGSVHPYASHWWPDAHVIGYEHTFINQMADMLMQIGGRPPVVALPDFQDAYQTQRVLEAASLSAEQKRAVALTEIPA